MLNMSFDSFKDMFILSDEQIKQLVKMETEEAKKHTDDTSERQLYLKGYRKALEDEREIIKDKINSLDL